MNHYGNDPINGSTLHKGARKNCPAPECGPDPQKFVCDCDWFYCRLRRFALHIRRYLTNRN